MAKNPKDGESRTFLISVAAELAGMHAQTLRTYDRLGLVSPRRTSGGGRRYSLHDVELLRQVQHLSQDEGVNLAGIKRIIELTSQVEALQSRLQEMAEELAVLRANQRREVAVVPKSTALVVWKPPDECGPGLQRRSVDQPGITRQ
ncbi:heat shock protein transcriptional repressor HspR [Mycobacterium tuberculosis]|uniref:heat shock protein transcriptional repressor HspR n=4 Tax=Mycobacterium tuberculosis TaxID=1773 RepID=UPI001F2991A8|nr:helix-turn-helix domain-containing protein [Mycobacterium tuberculosis]